MRSLVELLLHRADADAERPAYTFLDDAGETTLSFAELDRRSRAIGATLASHCAPGDRVILVLPPGLDYVCAFLGCLYAGAVAVPVYPPGGRGAATSLSRLEAIVADSEPAVAITISAAVAGAEQLARTRPALAHLRWVCADTADTAGDGPMWAPRDADRDDLAFLQYTSGSTGTPKGVLVSHGNLLANGADIERFMRFTPDSTMVSWLPPYHDMGLIGGILQTLHSGHHSVLMAPTDFSRDPLRWLTAISRWRADISGGPNFAYELCVRKVPRDQLDSVDLSGWRVAFNGAEPVREDVMARFAELTAGAGFRPEAFYPCYGLAEATLIVSGGRPEDPPVMGADGAVGCGRAAPGQRVAIVDPATATECGDGEVGEIWVCGDSVAGGYWGRPEETERTFHARLDDGTGPFLRTGDLGMLADGELFVAGRIKDLIIERGVNHYPQDLEHTASQAHPALQPNGGAAFSVEADGGERVVVAHEIARRHADADPEELITAIHRAVTAGHGVRPHAVVVVPAGTLPRTSSGKIQRHAVKDAFQRGDGPGGLDIRGRRVFPREQAIDTHQLAAVGRAAPADRAERIRHALVHHVAGRLALEPDTVDASAAAPALGLDSVGVLEFQHAVETELGVGLPAETFHAASLAELAELVAAQLETPAGTDGAASPPDAVSSADAGLASPGERGLWLLDRFTSAGAAYNLAVAVRLPEGVDSERLEAAATRLASRHPALRTTYVQDGDVVRRVVTDEVPVRLDHVGGGTGTGAAAGRAALTEVAAEPFDLAAGPLWRLVLCDDRAGDNGDEDSDGPEGSVLLLVTHHVIGDAWSLALLLTDLIRLYAGAEPPPPGDYGDFLDAQRAYLNSKWGRDSEAYWLTRLEGDLPLLTLPTSRPRPAAQTFAGARKLVPIDAGLAGRVREVAAEHGMSLYAVLHAAYQTVLHRYSGQTDVLVGSPVSGRGRASLARAVGYLVNVLVLRGDFRDDPTLRDVLRRTAGTVSDALAHQDYPFTLLAERVRAVRDPAYSAVFQAMHIHHQFPGSFPAGYAALAVGADVPEFEVEGMRVAGAETPVTTAQFDLTLATAEHGADIVVSLQYNTDLFDAGMIDDVGVALRAVLHAMTTAADTPVSAVPLLDEAARERTVRTWNETTCPIADADSVAEAFARQASTTPDLTAVVAGGEELTYRELAARSDRLARRLSAEGVGPGCRVGLLLERTPDLVVGMLGVLSAGAAYVPLDPDHPPARLATIAEDACLDVLVTSRGPRRRVPVPAARTVDVDDLADDRDDAADRADDGSAGDVRPPRPGDPAYVLYTSGSTGVPKGVVVTHRNVLNLFAGLDERIGCGPADTMLAVTSAGFDISVLELLWTLCRGAKVVLAPDTASTVARAPRGRPLDFSLFYFASATPADTEARDRYRLVLDGARFADEHGFAAVWTPERHFHSFGGLYPNPSVLSAALATVTERVELRAGSVVLPLHSSVRVAEEWSLVDNLSHGRAGIAFASGWHADDFVFFPDRYADRKNHMFAEIETVRSLWRGEPVSVPSGSGRDVEIRLHPAPVRAELPVWVTAAGSPETFERAGAIGANVLTHLLGQTVDGVAANVTRYRAARAAHGHDPAAGTVTLMLHTFIGTDLAEVRELVREPFTDYLRSSVSLIENLVRSLDLPIDLDGISESDMAGLLSFAFDRYFSTGALFGTPDTVGPQLDRLSLGGVDEVACLIDFGLPDDVVLEGLERLDEVRAAHAAPPAPSEAAGMPGAPETLAGLISRHRPTMLQATPSMMRLVSADADAMAGLRGLRVLLVGGEALSSALAGQLTTELGVRLVNMYGPTETTVWSATHDVTDPSTAIPIGMPIAGTQLHVVGRGLEPLPIGVPGELVIGGAGVADGYWGRPELTAQRFVPDPFATDAGGRLYRTGDLARRRADGAVEYLGRTDRQVKIRGHRVELGDVEAALRADERVREAVVVADTVDGAGRDRLVAYVVAAPGASLTQTGLLDGVRALLPRAMMPSAVVFLPELPLTPNGKIDVRALPAPGTRRDAEPAPPATELQRRIADVWREVLAVDAVGLHDNFFDLGGHSVLMVQVHGRLRELVGRDVPLIKLLEHPTVNALAGYLGGEQEPTSFEDSERRARRQRESRRARSRTGGRRS